MKLRFLAVMVALAGLAVSASAGNKPLTITVKNAHDFIKAIGPDRTIEIASKTPLNITDELEKMIASGEIHEGPTYYDVETAGEVNEKLTYTSNFDGNGLQVRNCDGLTIKGKGKGATLLASPRYVNVMEFINCNFLNIENVTMGHTDGGYCDKGVVEFDGCLEVTINNSDFFGCGTEGFVFESCNRVTVNNSVVHDCTYYTMHVKDCTQVRFNDCTFSKNREFSQINIFGSDDVCFTGCLFDSLEGELFNLDTYYGFYNCTFRNCRIDPIVEDPSFFPNGNAILGYCRTLYGSQKAVAGAKKPKIKLGLWTDGETIYRVTQTDPYRYIFTSTEGDGDVFAVVCFSVEHNEYSCAPEFPFDNKYGRQVVDVTNDGKRDYIRILDDGHQLVKSFVYNGKN